MLSKCVLIDMSDYFFIWVIEIVESDESLYCKNIDFDALFANWLSLYCKFMETLMGYSCVKIWKHQDAELENSFAFIMKMTILIQH